MSNIRMGRIEEEVKKSLSDIVKYEINDPRVHEFTSITAVEVTKDLKHAKVHVSVFDDEEKKNNTIKGLNSASNFIRKELGKRLNLRYTPELHFVIDNSIEYGVNISKILKDISGNDNGTN